MSQHEGESPEHVDRRSVLKSFGAAGLLGLSAGTVQGAQLPSSETPAEDVEQPPSVRGSVEQVVVTNAVPESTVILYGPDGNEAIRAQAGARGSYVFSDIEPSEGYRASHSIDGEESPRSDAVAVLSTEYTPPQEFYDQQELTEGFGYLEVRDGTTLANQVVLPSNQDPPYPTLVIYSGYEPSVSVPGGEQLINILVEGMGYALVGVNMRGSACSGGKFDFGERLQRLDGYDMVETVAAQDWSDSVGLVGLSFPGFTQLYVAAEQPPSLDAIAPGAPIGDFYRDTAYPGGIENTRFAKEWARERDEAFEPGGESGNVDQRIADGDETCEANQQLRLQNEKIVDQMERNPFDEGSFRERGPQQFLDQIDVPTFLVVSWQDEQTGPRAARLYEQLDDDIPARFTGTNGGHTEYFTSEIVDDLFQFYTFYLEEEVPDGFEGSYEEALAEYESEPITMYGERSNGQSPLARTAKYSTTHSEWPVEGVETWDRYCQPDGTLAESPPESPEQETSSYEYTALSPEEQQISRDDQGRLQWEQRGDDRSVAFVTEELDEDTACLGSGLVEMWLSSTAEDTDVQVTLSEVRPDGQEMFVQMGVLRASRRAEDPERSKPRRPYHTHTREDAQPLGDGFERMRVEIFPFGHVFREGSRIRLAIEVPGGNRDRWAFDLYDEDSTVEIAHSAEMLTKLSLPLVPEFDAEIPEYPACGELRQQPCREADLSFLDDEGDESDEEENDSDEGDERTDENEDETGDDGTEGSAEDETGESNDTDDDGPGFTVGGTLAGLGGIGYLLKRRLRGRAETTQND